MSWLPRELMGLLAGTTLWIAPIACSDDKSLACGTGTVERDGACVAAEGSAGSGAGGGCASPTVFFKDTDGDGYGGKETQSACASPGKDWVAKGGDCDDSDAQVFPGARAFHATPTKSGSFDYDCDGVETPDPGAQLDPKCGGAYPGCAMGEGYFPLLTNRGPGTNAHCGSQDYAVCGAQYASGA